VDGFRGAIPAANARRAKVFWFFFFQKRTAFHFDFRELGPMQRAPAESRGAE
jgi:hypothetical protein